MATIAEAKRTQLLQKVKDMPDQEIQCLDAFVSGMETGKAIQATAMTPNEEKDEKKLIHKPLNR